jgi:hypothetical protein
MEYCTAEKFLNLSNTKWFAVYIYVANIMATTFNNFFNVGLYHVLCLFLNALNNINALHILLLWINHKGKLF